MAKRSKRLRTKITGLEKQRGGHKRLIREHKDVKGKQHTLGYWAKEVSKFEKQIDDSRRILRRTKKRR